tara:strand:+ start:808 stop:1386 length:579 start_codon:yes stop_codon:yes gene_type:complete
MNILNGIPYEAFFAIYLIIACNFIGELFGCKFRQMLQENMYLKHLFGFLTFSFLVILVGIDINDVNDVIKGILYSIIFYIWFVLTTKTHIYITMFVLIIFLTMYIISIKIKKLEEKNKDIKKYKLINNILLIFAFIITIIGVINYLILKKRELNKRKIPFSYLTFFIGKLKCRNDKIENIDLVNNIKYAKLI